MIQPKQFVCWLVALLHFIGGPVILYLAYKKQVKIFYFSGAWMLSFGVLLFVMGIIIGRAERRLKDSRARMDASRESFMQTVEEYRSQSGLR